MGCGEKMSKDTKCKCEFHKKDLRKKKYDEIRNLYYEAEKNITVARESLHELEGKLLELEDLEDE